MDKKLVQNYLYNVLYQMLVLISPFITTPYLTRVMGAEALSINSWTANIVQWFVLFGIMGVNTYGNKEIAKVRDDKDTVSKTFFEIFLMQLASMLLSTAVFFVYAHVLGNTYYVYLMIQSISLLSVSLDITWFFYGVEDFKKASIRNMLVKIVGICMIFTFIKSPDDLMKFIFINATVGVCGQLIMWAQLKEYVHFVKVDLKGILRHVKPNIALFVPQIAISVYSVLDITMLGAFYEDIRHVNFYEQAQKFVKMFLFFVTSIGSVMLPRVSHVYHQQKYDQVERYLNKTLRFAVYMSIPMIFGISGMIQNFIDWFLPIEYECVGNMIMYTSPIILFISLSNVFGTQFLVPTGRIRPYTISVLSGACLNFVINLLLIPKYGAYGAIIGSVSAELTVTLIQWFAIRNLISLKIGFGELLKVMVASVLMFVPVRFLACLGCNILVNVIQVSAGVIVYAVVLIVLKAEFVKEMLQSLKNRGKAHA
ncbi:MAG: oligosaccharide flippase family protein [Erysipelotrichaceae bacterium]|nr:oligosaccharide flippase family protein [Erysipelotrichaceae bacterium]